MPEQPTTNGNGEAKKTSLATLRAADEATEMGYGTGAGFALMQRVAQSLANSTLLPPDFRGNLPNCLIALEMAQRLNASPLMVCQHLYIVHGRPGWSAAFLIASFNQCGRFSTIKYRWTGTKGKGDRGCIAYATELATKELVEGPEVTWEMVKAEGWDKDRGSMKSKWVTLPDLMFMYRSAAFLVRTHAPEISMGLQTEDELRDSRPSIDAEVVSREEPKNAITLDAIRADIPPAEEPHVEPVDDAEEIVTDEPPADPDTGGLAVAVIVQVKERRVNGRRTDPHSWEVATADGECFVCLTPEHRAELAALVAFGTPIGLEWVRAGDEKLIDALREVRRPRRPTSTETDG